MTTVIIDIHAHLWEDLSAQVARAATAGIDRSILLSTRFHPEGARRISDVRDEFQRLLEGLDGEAEATASEHHAGPSSHERSMTELTVALERTDRPDVGLVAAPIVSEAAAREFVEPFLVSPHIVGIGELTPAGGHGAEIEPFLRIARDHGDLPVLTHGFLPNNEADMRAYAHLAARYPSVPLIVGAFGGMAALPLIELAVETPNLYLDLSSALQVFMMAAAVREVPEQCLFGSNSPYGDVLAARTAVEAAVADPAARAQVFGLNAQRIFGLEA